jgi:hypothetical protein
LYAELKRLVERGHAHAEVVEGLLRVLFADQATTKDLRAALETTARQAREKYVGGRALAEELLATGNPFPQRLHLTERVSSFYGEFILLLTR